MQTWTLIVDETQGTIAEFNTLLEARICALEENLAVALSKLEAIGKAAD